MLPGLVGRVMRGARLRGVLSVLGNAIFGLAALVIGVTILGLTVLPPVLRYQTYVVLSGSMEPAIHVGSVIIATAADPDTLRVGDIVTYVRPGDQENITHRIVQIKGNAQGRTFVTQGDANGAPDPGEVRFDRLAGRVQTSIPYLGYVFGFIGSQQMRFLFIVVPGILLLGSWLWDVWKPEPKDRPQSEEELAGRAPAPVSPPAAKTANDLGLGVSADAAAVPLRR